MQIDVNNFFVAQVAPKIYAKKRKFQNQLDVCFCYQLYISASFCMIFCRRKWKNTILMKMPYFWGSISRSFADGDKIYRTHFAKHYIANQPQMIHFASPCKQKVSHHFLQCAEWSRLWNLQHKSEILWSQQQIGTWKGPFIWFFSLTMQLQHIKQSYGLKFSHLMTVADPKAVSKIALVKEVLNTDRVNNMNPKYFIRLK